MFDADTSLYVDDSLIQTQKNPSFEHEVVNSTRLARVVLLIRFWHPELTSPSIRQAVLQQVLTERADAYRDRWVPPLQHVHRTIEDKLPLYTSEEDGEATCPVVCTNCGPKALVELGSAGAGLTFKCTQCNHPVAA